jgi:sialic acid synthase SpsE
MTTALSIQQRAVGEGRPPFVIAEIGTNHNRDLTTACALVRGIAAAGCDAAKFQIYEPEEIVSGSVSAKDYGLDTLYGEISAQEMFRRHLQTPKEWFPELRDLCHELGIACGATIHGDNGRAWAKAIGIDFVKIASMDHTNLPLLRSLVNEVTAPVLISFGLAELPDIDAAMATLRPHAPGVGLFHCVAVYPPAPDELRLSNIAALARRYAIPVGFSDHTLEVDSGAAAVRLGAVILEKHVTLDRGQPGPDHPFALEMGELALYVERARKANREAVGEAAFLPPACRERSKRASYLKSVIARRDLPAGHVVSAADVYCARPGTGIPPTDFERVVGARVRRRITAEDVIQWADLERTG